ncbi:MAG: hypothetical protein WDZ69_00985 [Candidatus Pacearchaeota archaeon]
MEDIEKKLNGIVIPSGNKLEDIERAKTAIEFNKRNSSNVPYIISGIGPDINEALFNGRQDKNSLDFHWELYDYIMKNTEGIAGLDIRSLNSEQNILNTFPEETSGRYALVSYPLHLRRFKGIVDKYKSEGEISKDLEIEYVPTRKTSSLNQIIYEGARFLKKII